MRRVVVGSVLLLAACGSKNSYNEGSLPQTQPVAVNSANQTSEAKTAESQGNTSETATAASNILGTLPPADAILRFVGTWATRQANCASRPWHFTADTLTGAGAPHCSIYKVSKAPGGYDLAAQCPDKKPIPTDLIKLRFAESARAMLVESNAIKPTGLIYCGK